MVYYSEQIHHRKRGMKQFIVLLGVLPIMLVFLFQFTLDQNNSHNIGRFQDLVYASKEEAKQQGCFTNEIRTDLVQKISSEFGIAEQDVELTADAIPKYRTNSFDKRELIYYKVSVPIKQLMAGNKFYGISDEENQTKYTIESWTASELLKE